MELDWDIGSDVETFKEALSLVIDKNLGRLERKCMLQKARHEEQSRKIQTTQEENDALKKELEVVRAQVDEHKASLHILQQELDYTKNMIGRLEDENSEFKKVSQIIHYEKENARLRQQLAFLEERLAKFSVKKDERSDLNLESQPAPELSVYEKKIKNIVYFVTDDDERRIFERTEDGEIGNELGKLVIDEKTNKYRPVWT